MKRNQLRISFLMVIVAAVTMSFTTRTGIDLSHYKTVESDVCYYVPNEDEVKKDSSSTIRYELVLGKTYLGFKEALGFKESQGNYSVINEYGYMGKYQFGKSTLKMIGIYNPEVFLNDSKLQEAAFAAYTSRNKWILRREIIRYDGRYINGVKVTESGILAAAHLAGAGNVKKYLRSGGTFCFADAFGTTIGNYLKKFSGYDTSFIVADKLAKANII